MPLSLHRVRQSFVSARIAQANQIRGLLAEYGLIVPKGIGYIAACVPDLIEDAIDEIQAQIKACHRDDEISQKLQKVPGIGQITASALAATEGDEKKFDDGRQMACWLGLVPSQNSSRGKQPLLGMSKRGDAYLKTRLTHGA